MKHLLLILLILAQCHNSYAQDTQSRLNERLLQTARRDGMTNELEDVLSRGASINAQDQFGVTALMWYAYNRNFIVVDWLIKHGANMRLKGTILDPNDPAMYYGHALAAAVGQNDYGTVRTLLQNGFPIDEPGRAPGGGNGFNALHTACYRGDLSMVGGLLYGFVQLEQAGRANPNTPCEAAAGKTPLQMAIERGHEDIVQVLIKAGAKSPGTTITPDKTGNRLISAIQDMKSAADITRLLASGADPNEQDVNGATALMWAAYINNEEVVARLLSRGANPHKRGIIKNPNPKARFPHFGNALVAAIGNNSFASASILIQQGGLRLYEAGAGPDGKSNSWNALHVSSYKGDIFVIDQIEQSLQAGKRVALMAGPSLNQICTADHNMTAALYAADGNQADWLARLAATGADLRAATTEGWTVLHFAARNGSAKLMQIALDAGLAPEQKTASGLTPAAIAVSNQHNELVTLLKTYKPDLTKYAHATPSATSADSVMKVAAEEEIAQVMEYMRQPDLLSDELERRGSLYERSGQPKMSNLFFVEAALVRERQLLDRDLPYPTFCRELKDLGPEGEEKIGGVIKFVEKFKKLGCVGAAAGKGAADNLTVLGLHRYAADYYQKFAPCQEKSQDWEELFQSQRTLSLNLRACGRFKEAEAALVKARQVAFDHLRGKRRTQAAYAIALDEQGALLLMTQHYAKQRAMQLAQQVLEQADSTWRTLTGDLAYRHAGTLNQLAQVYLITKPASALATVRRAISIAPAGSLARANALRTLALVQDRFGQNRQAVTAWTQALNQYRLSVKQTHPYYIRVLDDLSKHYRRLGHPAEASSFQLEATGLASFLGNAVQLRPRSADPIGELIYFWETNFNHELGNSRMRDLFDLFDIDSQPSEPDDLGLVRISDQVNQAILARDQGDTQTARRLFASAIERYRQSESTAPEFFVPMLELTADCSQRLGDNDKAFNLLNEAYEQAEQNLGTQHSAYLSVLHKLAWSLASRNDWNKAGDLYKKGLQQLNLRVVSQINALSEDEFLLTKRALD